MLKIYGFPLSSRANKVQMCANAMDIDYEYKLVNVLADEHKTDAYLALHPARKIPVIDDDGFVLFESNAIIKYLAKKHASNLYASDPAGQGLIDQWCDFVSHHIDNHFVSLLLNKIIFPKMGREIDQLALKERPGFIEQYLGVLDKQLGKNRYLAGEQLSIADICLVASIDPSEMIGVDTKQYPRLDRWRVEMRSQDFYLRVHKVYGESMQASDR